MSNYQRLNPQNSKCLSKNGYPCIFSQCCKPLYSYHSCLWFIICWLFPSQISAPHRFLSSSMALPLPTWRRRTRPWHSGQGKIFVWHMKQQRTIKLENHIGEYLKHISSLAGFSHILAHPHRCRLRPECGFCRAFSARWPKMVLLSGKQT